MSSGKKTWRKTEDIKKEDVSTKGKEAKLLVKIYLRLKT